MAEIRAVIVDDEPLARRGVAQLLEPHGDIRIVGEGRDGRDALRLVRLLEPDLLFLDIEMPELDGLAVLSLVSPETRPIVVLLTAHERYAVRGFEVEAIDYLLKPPVASRFDACLIRVRRELERRRREQPGAARREPLHGVLVQHREDEHLLRPEQIDWIEAADYCSAVYARGTRYVVRESLDSLEARLPERFFLRVHRSALVNLTRVVRLGSSPSGTGTLELQGGFEVPVSRRRRAGVRRRLQQVRSVPER